MSTPIATTVSPPVQPSTLGSYERQYETASTQAESLKKQLSAAVDARNAAPPAQQPALERKVATLRGQLQKANDRVDKLSWAVTQSMGKIQGPLEKNKTANLSQAVESGQAKRKAKAGERQAASEHFAKLDGQVKAAHPPSPELLARRNSAKARLDKASGELADLDAGLSLLQGKLLGREKESLSRRQDRSEDPMVIQLDGLDDAARLPRDKQVELLGAPVPGVTTEKTAQLAAQKIHHWLTTVSVDSGAGMLARQLDGATEEQQVALLNAAGPDVKRIISDANTGAGSAMALADALSRCKGAARTLLVNQIAAGVDSDKSEVLSAFSGRLGAGRGFAEVGELSSALTRAGKTGPAVNLSAQSATSLKGARVRFETAQKKVDALNAEVGRLTYGFGQAIAPEKLQAYYADFRAKHADEYGEYEAAAKAYFPAFQAAAEGSLDPTIRATPGPIGEGVRSELTRALDHSPELLESKEGKSQLASALSLQVKGEPNWLTRSQEASEKGKKLVEWPEKAANTLAKGIVSYASMSGKGPGAISQLAQKNSALLGIPHEKIAEFTGEINEINNSGLTANQVLEKEKQALGKLKGGEYKFTKAAGLLLTLPTLVNGVVNWKDQSAVQNFKTVLDGAHLSADALSFVMKDSQVLAKISSAAGPLGGALSIAQGFGQMWGGENFDGAMNIYAGLGAVMMAIPGGQVFGAALLIGSSIAKYVFGKNPAAEAESAAEEETRRFLVNYAGLKPGTAEALSDVLRKDLRSVGSVLPQLAERLHKTPAQLLQQLDSLPAEKVESFVKMAKEMPSDDRWQYSEHPKDKADLPEVKGEMAGVYFGPKSVDTAVQWMRDNGVIPRSW